MPYELAKRHAPMRHHLGRFDRRLEMRLQLTFEIIVNLYRATIAAAGLSRGTVLSRVIHVSDKFESRC